MHISVNNSQVRVRLTKVAIQYYELVYKQMPIFNHCTTFKALTNVSYNTGLLLVDNACTKNYNLQFVLILSDGAHM